MRRLNTAVVPLMGGLPRPKEPGVTGRGGNICAAHAAGCAQCGDDSQHCDKSFTEAKPFNFNDFFTFSQHSEATL